ncbi:uncharacterized protein LOC133959265 [Platichthys flesus]|uniref:uncharacterized protein LOC133959265 n=1 Tax=Platichthys flesus TaxID=8260 RepID=UPI002DBBD9E9|nr:uncharacterized protein LOC133959265 [Platichthys flesus]
MDHRIRNVPLTLISSRLNLSSSTLSSSPVPLISSRLNLSSSTLSSSPVPLISSGLTLISSPIISSPVTLISSRLNLSSSTLSSTPSSPALSPSSPAASPSPPSAKVCVPSDILETVVHNIWAGKKPEVLWSKAGPYKLFTRNLQEHLRPDALVESEIINAYLTIALSNFSEAGRGRGYLLDSFQMTDIWRGKNKGLRKIDPLDYDVLIGAVCEHHHWTLTVMYPKKRQSLYVDPFGASEEALKKCTAVTR